MEKYQHVVQKKTCVHLNPLSKKVASRDYSKVRYSADPEKARAAAREQYSANPETKMAAAQEQYSTIPETKKAAARELYSINPEKKTGCFPRLLQSMLQSGPWEKACIL